jgi:hypothetical protein
MGDRIFVDAVAYCEGCRGCRVFVDFTPTEENFMEILERYAHEYTIAYAIGLLLGMGQ